MSKPTKTTVAGKFQSKSGDDFVQYVDDEGKIISWIDSTGQPQGQLLQVLNLIASSDAGTF